MEQINDGVDLWIKAEENKLQSEMDPLTGLLNRRKFLQVLNEQWNDSKQLGLNMSLIIIDVDYFKQFNDNYGHLEGDKCLKTVAQLLSSIPKKYFLCRYGGDEFFVMLPESDNEQAVAFAEAMRKAVLDSKICHEYSPISEFVTVTLGVTSIIPTDDLSVNELIKKADDALYAAKRKGRNKVEWD